MVVEVVHASEYFTLVSLASDLCAMQLFLRTTILAVNLALVSIQATGVCEAL
jgi:hypothetical protein